MRILELPKIFRPSTSIVYPPFKKGRYMEEYFYNYVHLNKISNQCVYIPIFWTNLQIHPAFNQMRNSYNIMLNDELKKYSKDTLFMTVIQHDDGPQLDLPYNTIIFGGCCGNVSIPLIYEDYTERLLNVPRINEKKYLASFVGTYNTHKIRERMYDVLKDNSSIYFHNRMRWSSFVTEIDANIFIEMTQQSKFCLAPRGYGSSSFRFYEAMLLDVVPVYIWEDMEWLPYKDVLDYSKFSVCIHANELDELEKRLGAITEEEYSDMIKEIKRVRPYFLLEGMSEYIERYCSEIPIL